MRYNKEDVTEMSGRLGYLVETFSKHVERGDKFPYVGPKVADAAHIRQQDFVTYDSWPSHANRLAQDLLNAAKAQDKMAEVTPVMVAAANVIRTLPEKYQDIPSMKGLIVG